MSYHDSTLYWERVFRRYLQRYDGKSRFVQNGHKKKSKNQNREDWRARKGFARDQAKRDRRGCPVWIKRQCNKHYRAWVRNKIETERFDEIRWRKDFYDPWMWD